MTLTVITLNTAGITDFAAARNAELAKATTDWVLFLDADETITPGLQKEIDWAVKSNHFDAYYLKRRDTFMGHALRHGEPGRAKFIRLARQSFGRWHRPVHEKWLGQGRVGELTHPLRHSPHSSLSAFLAKIDRYSTLDAQYRYQEGQKSSLAKITFYPLAKFSLNYFLRLGFLDGVPGAVMAIMMSFHSYLTWTKLYLLWQKN